MCRTMTSSLAIALFLTLIVPLRALAGGSNLVGDAGAILVHGDESAAATVLLDESLADTGLRLLQVVFDIHGAEASWMSSEPTDEMADRVAIQVEALDDAHLSVVIFDTVGEPIPLGEPLFVVGTGQPVSVVPRLAIGEGADGATHLFTLDGDDEILAQMEEVTGFASGIEDFFWSPCRIETIALCTAGCAAGNLTACAVLAYCGTKALYEDLSAAIGSGYHPGCNPCEYNDDDNCGKVRNGVSGFYTTATAWGVTEDEACDAAREKAEEALWEDDRLQQAGELCREIMPCDEGCPQDECTGCEENYWIAGTSQIGRSVEVPKVDPYEELTKPPMFLGLSCTISVLMDYHCECTRCERHRY